MLFSTCPAASVYSSGASLIHAEFVGRLCQPPAANIGVSPNALQQRLRLITQFAVHNPRRGCVRMRFDFVCAENVQHFQSARFQVIRDKRAMATPPDRFCAHDCDRARSDGFPAVTLISTAAQAVAPCKGKKTFYGFLEL